MPCTNKNVRIQEKFHSCTSKLVLICLQSCKVTGSILINIQISPQKGLILVAADYRVLMSYLRLAGCLQFEDANLSLIATRLRESIYWPPAAHNRGIRAAAPVRTGLPGVCASRQPRRSAGREVIPTRTQASRA